MLVDRLWIKHNHLLKAQHTFNTFENTCVKWKDIPGNGHLMTQ